MDVAVVRMLSHCRPGVKYGHPFFARVSPLYFVKDVNKDIKEVAR